LHLTDPHLFADDAGSLRGTVTQASFNAALAHYRESDWRADIVVVTGDLIQDDSTLAYDKFRQMVGELGLPVYCVPGNHDVRESMRATLNDGQFYYCESFESHDWLVVGIDSCAAGRAGGIVIGSELDRLDVAIDSTPAQNVMVCLHHPPVAMGSTWLDTVGLDNGAEFLQRAATSGKVRLAIFGHVHQEYDAVHNSIRVVGTPSTCRQFKQSSDVFAVDDNPPAYRRITLQQGGDASCELIWVENA
jgi:Icc protein